MREKGVLVVVNEGELEHQQETSLTYWSAACSFAEGFGAGLLQQIFH